jgi:predicted nucleotidyltransferase
MDREQVLSALREQERELRSAGVASLSLFGSMARREPNPGDVDIAVRLDKSFSEGGFDYFWRRQQLAEHLSRLLGCRVDVVEEPALKPSLQEEIDRDRAVAF